MWGWFVGDGEVREVLSWMTTMRMKVEEFGEFRSLGRGASVRYQLHTKVHHDSISLFPCSPLPSEFNAMGHMNLLPYMSI